jgi:non-specific serine/threonine protein kinase/serine/threonine-protein kinase
MESDPNPGRTEPIVDDLATRASGPGEAKAGGVIGPYHLLELIGEGGMGQVWLAEQREPVRRRVALKLIKAGMDTREVVARFQSERQALALMDHPAIAKVFDAGSTPHGLPYFVMEYVAGLPITAYADKHKLTTRQRLELFMLVCDGVQHAHQKAIIHRDLKPSNILVSELDGKPMPRIIDFGVAKATSQRLDAGTMYTQVGAVIGTLGYMSPEQADSGGEDIDTRSDVYSLGVVLYELLVGALPHDFKQIAYNEAMRQLREEDAPRPSTKLRTLGDKSANTAQNRGADPAALTRQLRGDPDAITLKALEKDRKRRYGSPTELASDIGRYLRNEPVTAHVPSLGYRGGKYIRRHRLGVVLSTALLLLLIGFAIAQTVALRRITRERDRADRITEFMTNMFKTSDPSNSRGKNVTARELLDKASKDIDTGLKNDPLLQAQMMHIMGDVYESLGQYQQAEGLVSHAMQIRRDKLGQADAETLKSAQLLAGIYEDESRYPEAEKLYRETLDLRRRTLGLEDRDTLSTEKNLGTTVADEGRYAEAEQLQRQVVEAARRRFGEQDALTSSALDNLAIDLAQQGNFPEAEKLFREILDDDRRAKGDDHPDTLDDMNNLGAILLQEGHYDESEKVYREAIQIKQRVYGPEHPSTLTSMGSLALDLTDEKRYPEAEALYRQTLEIKRKRLGDDHRLTLVTAGNLGSVLTQEGKYAEAEALTRKTLEAERRTLGSEHSDTLTTVLNLAELEAAEKHLADADKDFREAFEGIGKSLGMDHPSTAGVAYEYACVLALEGKRDEAFSKLEFAVDHPLDATHRKDLITQPDLNSLHADPRWAAIAAKAGQAPDAPKKP